MSMAQDNGRGAGVPMGIIIWLSDLAALTVWPSDFNAIESGFNWHIITYNWETTLQISRKHSA